MDRQDCAAGDVLGAAFRLRLRRYGHRTCDRGERWVCLECKLKTLSELSWRLRPLQIVLTSPMPCTLPQRPAMLAPSQPSIEISRDAAKGD